MAVAEERELGGTCPLRGCMPKKILAIGADKMRWSLSPGPAGIETSLDGLNWEDVIEAEQSIVSLLGDRIIVATGLRPVRPPIDGIEHAQTSDEFFVDETLPDSVVIIGGGYIGVEFASILNGFGVDVTVVEMLDHILDQHDRDVSRHLLGELRNSGIDVRLNTQVESIRSRENGYAVRYQSEDQDGEALLDRIIVAAGRAPNTGNLGLGNTDVSTNQEGLIRVDEDYQTDAKEIYAVGDVIGDPQLTPAAIQEGVTAAKNAVNGTEQTLDFSAIPSAVFSHPPVGSAGMTEREARAEFSEVAVGTNTFKPFGAAVKDRDEKTYIKTVFDETADRLVGVHVVGDSAPDLIQGFALALQEGCSRTAMDTFPGVHPTVAEEVFAAVP